MMKLLSELRTRRAIKAFGLLAAAGLLAVSTVLLVSHETKTKILPSQTKSTGSAQFGSLYAFQEVSKGDEETNDATTYIMNGSKPIGKQQGYDPTFSPNGRYVLSSEAAELHIYDTRYSHQYLRSLIYQPPLGCYDQSLTNSFVYVADPTLIRYSLPGFSDPVHLKARLPAGPICPMATLGNSALVVVGTSHGWELYEVSPSGASRHLGPNPLWTTQEVDALDRFQIIATPRASNGDPEIAYSVFGDTGNEVYIVDVRTNRTFEISSARLDVPLHGAGKANDLYLQDMWWATDGQLYSIMASNYNNSPVIQQQTWQLGNGEWVPWNSAPVVDVRYLETGYIIEQTPIADFLQRPWGNLYIRYRAKITRVATWTFGLSLPSEESIAPPFNNQKPPVIKCGSDCA
ncbi:MAG: hypothetical protein ACRDHZ_03780 [Ktedonobacteraceae bacterium]